MAVASSNCSNMRTAADPPTDTAADPATEEDGGHANHVWNANTEPRDNPYLSDVKSCGHCLHRSTRLGQCQHGLRYDTV